MLNSYQQLVNHGYIRRIEGLVHNKTIPNSIYDICFHFYSMNTIVYISPKINYGLHIASFDHELNWYSNTNFFNENNAYDFNSYCYIENIKLPKKQRGILFDNNKKQNMNAIVQFTSGSSETKHELILFNQNQLRKNNHTKRINTKRLELPFLKDIGDCCLIYSNTHGIVSIGGFLGDDNNVINSVYYLELINNDWKWNTLPNLKRSRCGAACTIINRNSNNEKYFIVGGFGQIFNTNDDYTHFMDSVEMYECKTNKWISLNNVKYKRCQHGIYMDEINNIIYLGGGNNEYDVRVTEYFDIVKNKWYEILPKTESHNKPIIWKNENLLYIASAHSNIQYIDLRMNNKKWNEQKLLNVFGDSISDMHIEAHDRSHVLLNLKY
eukprot:510205_1